MKNQKDHAQNASITRSVAVISSEGKMTYNPELWRMPDDRIWALKAAADTSGMMPHAETTAKFLMTMELEGLVRQSEVASVWFITDAGRAELTKLEAANRRKGK